MAVENQAFLDIEFSLESALSKAWDHAQGDSITRGIRAALEAGDFPEAHRRAQEVSFSQIMATRAGLVDQFAVAAFLLGQSFFTEGDLSATSVGGGDDSLPFEVPAASTAFVQSLTIAGADPLRKALAAVVSDVEASEDVILDDFTDGEITTQKAVIPGLGAALNRAVLSGKQVGFGMGANLTTSRLASLGAIVQMQKQGVTSFQRSAVLDSRTCPVCRALHGQVFTLKSQRQRLTALLMVADPKELAGAAPFPSQNAAGLVSLAAMTKLQIMDKGIDLPPSHPFCRCVILPVGAVPGSQVLGPAALFIPRATLATDFSVSANVSTRLGLLDELGAGVPGQFPAGPVPLKAAKDTQELFKVDGVWIPSRAKLHTQIVDDLTAGVEAQQAKPVFHMMGGGPASGKSTTLDAGLVKLPKSHVLIDSDDIKDRLPEFRVMIANGDTRAAAFLHEESSFLAKETMAAGRLNQMDTVLDGTGDGGFASLSKKVNQFRAAGYQVSADYMTLPTDLAVKLATIRAKKKGRKVPETLIRKTHASVSRDFKRGVDEGIFDDVRLWDNEIKGKPRLVFSMEGGQQTIHDQTLWTKFLAKGAEGT